ncbi:L protein [Bat paramyxovirus]|nr:L protein [Bat paramyxovirus]
MADLSDILYPECHLDSPIVTGKLIELILYADLPCNQVLNDETLIRNIKINKQKNKSSPLIHSQIEFKQHLDTSDIKIKKINHVPYPNGNNELFRMTDSNLTQKLSGLLRLSNSAYSKISIRLLKLKNFVESKIGLEKTNIIDHDADKFIENSMLNLHRIMEGSRWYHPFMFWFTIKTDLRQLIKEYKSIQRSKGVPIITYNLKKYYIQMNRNMVLIYNKINHDTHYLTMEMVLMMSDVTEGRLMIDTIMNSDYRFKEFKSRGNALWDVFDSLFIDLGNQTYNIIAMIEPLTLGYLQLKDKSPELKGAFLSYALEELDAELLSNGIYHEEDRDVIQNSINKIFNTQDIHMTAEFFSFFRTFGHPTLEAEEAANKVREHMNKTKLIKFKTLMKGHALFCGIIINGYRDRHGGSWPPVTLPNHASRSIKNAQLNNESLIDSLCINEWKSFVGIKFKCFMPLSLDDDLTMFMKDKALAAIKSEWDSVYPKETMIYNPPPQTTSRRLVETFLADTEFDPAVLINYVLSGEYLNDPEFNLSYSLKEKEIKRVGRLFAKMTYKMRACQVVAESLIANGVGKYFKENGMAKDEHELLKTLHRLSVSAVPKDNKMNNKSEDHKKETTRDNRPINKQIFNPAKNKNKSSKVIKRLSKFDNEEIQYETISTFLTTDLQKFCLNWRQETSNIFAQRLNEIYGLPHFFDWLHKRLEKSVLYVADPHCPPEFKRHIDLDDVGNEHIFIKYPMGGIEGYCQKLWTIITIPFLFLSAYEVGAKIAAVVQGDNQAIAITRRVHPNLSYLTKKIKSTQLAQEYFNQLRKNMGDIGHNLKANETIVSSHFFVYSKRIYYDGIILSQSLKPISRVVFWSETLVDETKSACSNISTAISKSIEQGLSRWLGYALNVLKVLQQIVISLKYSINPSMTDDIVNPLYRNQNWLICSALIPSQLGGFNYMNMSRLYVRNIGDPVTASLADIKRMIHVKLIDESILQKIMNQEPGNSDYLDWASDPYSVNLPHSQSVTVILKNVTARTILSNSDNPMLRGLFHFDFDEEDRDLARFLMDRPLILPRAAHEIMDNSLTGARQEIAGMLDTTKGLIRNSIRLGGIRPRLVDKLSMYDYEQIRTFNNMMKNNKVDPLIDSDACSVTLAVNLRKRMWFNLTLGRPIYGLEVPDTIEVVKGYFINNCEDCDICVTGNLEYGWFFVPSKCELDGINKESNKMRVPYFGSTTDERSEIKLSHVRSPSRALRAAVRIAMVYTWAFGDSEESWNEAWYLASFRANVTLPELQAITPISTSNNIAHRLKDKSTTMKYSGNALNRVGRYIVISNDHLNFIIDGIKVDTNLVYQQIMLIGISTIEDKFRFQTNTGDENTLLHLHVNKSCCILEMNEHPYVYSEQPLPNLQQVDCNKLIYDDNPILDSDKTRLHTQLFRSSDLDFPNWDIQQLNQGLAQSLAMTIVEIITKETHDHMSEFKVLAHDDDVNSLITEFLLVNPSEFMLYLGMYVAVNWSYDIYYRRPEGKYQMLEFLTSIMNIAPKSNFTVLSNAISHPIVLRRFWDTGVIEPIYGPNLANQDFTRISIEMIITAYSIYMDYWLNGNQLEYMITESDENVIDQRFEITQARHLCFLSCLYLSRSEMPIIRGLTSIEKCNKLSEMLDEGRTNAGIYQDWNLEILPVIIHPASLTYVRRGTIKHIKLRNYLAAESFGYDKVMEMGREIKLYDLPKINFKLDHDILTYFPAIMLFSGQYDEFNYRLKENDDINRWENHVKRRVGMNSTSCYKALEISAYLLDKVDRRKDRVFLGEGSGAMMATYFQTLGPAVCYFNSGVSEHDTLGQRILNVQPSEYALVAKNNPDDNEMMTNLHILFNGKPESTWIGNMSSFKYIMNTIRQFSCSMVHCDMESSTTKNSYTILLEQVHSLCLSMNLLDEDGIYITKVAPKFNDYSNHLLALLYHCYSDVNVLIPASSNPKSSEIYICCKSKKIKTIVYPSMFLEGLIKTKYWPNIFVSEIILNLKMRNHIHTSNELNQRQDYLGSNLMGLTDNEKHLMSFGFRLNGPKSIKILADHDVSTGRDNLLSSINLNLNNILNLLDESRDKVPFFDPYPILNSSKVRESMELIARKVNMFFILYGFENEIDERNKTINNLRRKTIVLDMNSPILGNIIRSYLMKRYHELGINKIWIFTIDTVSIKNWWKSVGYSLLLVDNE